MDVDRLADFCYSKWLTICSSESLITRFLLGRGQDVWIDYCASCASIEIDNNRNWLVIMVDKDLEFYCGRKSISGKEKF